MTKQERIDIINKTSFLPVTSEMSQRKWHLKHNILEIPICPICNKNNRKWYRWYKGEKNIYTEYCSAACSSIASETRRKYKQTNILKYGCENPQQNTDVKKRTENTNIRRYGHISPSRNDKVKEKIKKTNLKKYGVEYSFLNKEIKQRISATNVSMYSSENPFSSSIIQERIKQTNILKYGCENPQQNIDIRNKLEQTNIQRYGHNTPLKNDIIKEKIKKTNIEKYGVENNKQRHYSIETTRILNLPEELIELNKTKTLVEIATILNINASTVGHYFKKHNIKIKYHSTSFLHQKILNFIQSIYPNENIENNNRKLISPKELDIYIPEKKLAIEINGIFWHSELNGKDKNYHIDKTLECNKNDTRLIQLFETEWILKEDIVKSRISILLGYSNKIYARRCEIKEISSDDKKYFIEKTHIQGDVPSSVNVGLFYKNELVMVMTFGKSRFNKKYQYELLRMSSELNTTIIGGANKLFQYFIKKYDPESVVSYCDLRWNTGNVYSKLGFEYSNRSSPNFWYFHMDDPFKLYSRIKFQKHKLGKILENYNPELTEYDNMLDNGYDRIWDCGNDVWVYRQ